jgi:serine/threonine protein phosphatase PrpC
MTASLDIGWVDRPFKGERVCGDRVELITDETHSLIAVIDGLGHGPQAAEASLAAAEYIRAHASRPLDEVLRGCDRAIRHTRGVAATVIRIDHTTLVLEHAGVGNVDLASTARQRVRAISEPGVIGGRTRKVLASQHQLERGDLLILHSDGISRRLVIDEVRRGTAQKTAEAIMDAYGKDHDDVSCAVVFV